MPGPFPQTPDLSGFNAPVRIECDLEELIVEGEIPAEIDGSWYRLGPDPYFPPSREDDIFFSGDGFVSRFQIRDGKASYKRRYIQTDRLQNDKAAGRSLYGAYRNPFTDDPSVQGSIRGTANTTPVFHGGKLLALKEDYLGMEIDPDTLETRGWWDFDGKLKSETVCAHPRIDFDTGEMFIFGFEAGGLCSRDVSYAIIDKHGELVSEQWFEVPYVSWMHDFVVTQEHVIFPVFPHTTDLDWLKAGNHHWKWDPSLPTYVGIMPRYGSVKEMRWFKGPAWSGFHFLNGFSDGNKVHMDFSVMRTSPFPPVREASGVPFDMADIQIPYMRWTFDLSQPGEGWTETPLCPAVGDFPRIADKDHMKDYEIGYYINYDPANGEPLMCGPTYMGFNTLTRMNVKEGTHTSFTMGPGFTFNESIHIASKQPGHEGYLAMVVDLHEEWLSDVVILEAAHIERGPIARIKMPKRLKNQIHGVWVDSARRRGEL